VPFSNAEIIQRLLLAVAIGGLIGAERELRRKAAGFRTNMLIGLGAAVFSMVGMSFSSGDPSRVAAQVVTGIGFLGARAILHRNESVQGLTTAATIWVNAALGVAAGTGHMRLAMIAGGITLGVLLVLGPIERTLEMRSGFKRNS
jgi:putative Mg2+ transporter-C (MgtC) family protein